MKLKELFKDNKIILTDGAMGTYFTELTGKSAELCERGNIDCPEIIRQIHTEYMAAGSKLLRTNTFSANSALLGTDHAELKEILMSGYRLAKEAAGDNAVVCADVSAIYENPEMEMDIEREYRFIVDCFIEAGAEVFIFETLSEIEAVMPAVRYIKEKMPDAEIITSFTVLPDGRTRSGLSVRRLLKSITENMDLLTAVGLNCGSGAAQLYQHAASFFSYIRENTDLFTIIMPNAGYPSIVNRRTVYNSAPKYFAEQTARLKELGVSAVGGCCGTTPEYIRLLAVLVGGSEASSPKAAGFSDVSKKVQPMFSSKLVSDKFIIAAELDPPNNSDFTKLLSAAAVLKQSGVDIITVSDSPLGHAKADSVICSARIKRELGIETLPHICCRDKNINALRSILLGAHSEGIRAVLAVTGDHIAETDRGIIKPVFNLDSTKLMSLIGEMNGDIFADEPLVIGGAFDPASPRAEFALKRLDKKIGCGAKFVLTQPVFTDKAIDCLRAAKEKNVKVLAGIMPMVSYRNACFLKNEVPGMTIPDEMAERFSPDMSREEAAKVGIEIAAEIAKKVMPYADGLYFVVPFNRAEMVKSVIERLSIPKNRG